MSGDKDFENFLNNMDNDDNHPPCQKRLLFDIIQQSMTHISEMYESSALFLANYKGPDMYMTKNISEFILNLTEQSRKISNKMDYLMLSTMDEIDGSEEK